MRLFLRFSSLDFLRRISFASPRSAVNPALRQLTQTAASCDEFPSFNFFPSPFSASSALLVGFLPFLLCSGDSEQGKFLSGNLCATFSSRDVPFLVRCLVGNNANAKSKNENRRSMFESFPLFSVSLDTRAASLANIYWISRSSLRLIRRFLPKLFLLASPPLDVQLSIHAIQMIMYLFFIRRRFVAFLFFSLLFLRAHYLFIDFLALFALAIVLVFSGAESITAFLSLCLSARPRVCMDLTHKNSSYCLSILVQLLCLLRRAFARLSSTLSRLVVALFLLREMLVASACCVRLTPFSRRKHMKLLLSISVFSSFCFVLFPCCLLFTSSLLIVYTI